MWELADKALVDGEYPVNANGETYGNYSLRELVGYAPDLVLAVNEDGVQGYVRNTDTPVMALSENGESSAAIPLYDKDGNVIGTFGNININEAQTAGVQNGYSFVQSVVNGIATAIGYTVSIVLLAGIRERIEGNDIPYNFQGSPIVLVTAGLMAIAFFGFSGLL